MKLQATDYTTEEIIKILREWTGLTQKDFGKTISRSERSIQSLESGDRHCTVDTLLQIARTHNIKIVITKDASK
ncbi:MAG: helix-turn-helix transcriptional regulator [bacterium]|nr:helix-turn-helix transcriptional regulator [bacterium]